MKSIEDQIQAMARQWPGFKVIDRFDRGACWEGVLVPDKREYVVQVKYRIPLVIENISLLNAQPRVQVIRPPLESHPDYEEGPIPHVYKCTGDPSVRFLCLFDPSDREWSCDDLIADTTIFWAVEWLYFYEGWLITKKWHGGGRHVIPAQEGAKRLETV